MAWQWTQPRIVAAQMVAEGKTLAEISSATKAKPQTISNWKKQSEFSARIDEIRKEMADALTRSGLRVKEYRLNKLNDILERIDMVIAGRANDMAGVPGGDSGLLVRKYKSVGGVYGEKATEYAFDRALVEELREVLKHAAQEVGEWTEKKELTGPGGAPLLDPLVAALEKAYGNSKQ